MLTAILLASLAIVIVLWLATIFVACVMARNYKLYRREGRRRMLNLCFNEGHSPNSSYSTARCGDGSVAVVHRAHDSEFSYCHIIIRISTGHEARNKVMAEGLASALNEAKTWNT